MFAIVSAALLGGPLTAVLLWKQGAIVALASAPVGGSCAALAVALALAAFRHAGENRTADPDHGTVASLR